MGRWTSSLCTFPRQSGTTVGRSLDSTIFSPLFFQPLSFPLNESPATPNVLDPIEPQCPPRRTDELLPRFGKFHLTRGRSEERGHIRAGEQRGCGFHGEPRTEAIVFP